jgi:DNA-binding transcriptional LysR family regulator
VERDARGARLTASGRHAVDRLTIALASLEQAIQAARTPAIAPLLRLGCIQVASMSRLPAALNRLARTNVLGRLQIREGRARELLAGLCAGDLDCVIGWIDETLIDGLPVEGLRIEPLWYGRMQVVAAVSHPLVKLRAVSVDEIGRWPWIVPPPGSRTHAAFLRLFVHNGVPAPPATVECSALHTTLHIVSATRFLAMAPDAAVRHYARLGMVKPLSGPTLRMDYNQVSVVTRRDADAFLPLQDLKRVLLEEADRAG